MIERKNRYWRICVAFVVVLILITFTPLVIPVGVYKPMFLGIPYSLWVCFIITAALVFLTYIGAKVHPGIDEEEEELS